jgi:hypothetical protein
LWFLGWNESKEEELRQTLAESIRNNVPLFKNVYGTVSVSKMTQHIAKREPFRDVSALHLAFSIWQKRTIIFIGKVTFRFH